MKIICQCCSKQILPGVKTPDRYVTSGPPIQLVNGYCCQRCGEGLDENGLWPEERAEWEEFLKREQLAE